MIYDRRWIESGMSECPSITKLRGATPLHYAVRFDNFLFAEFLLSKGAKITVDNGGEFYIWEWDFCCYKYAEAWYFIRNLAVIRISWYGCTISDYIFPRKL